MLRQQSSLLNKKAKQLMKGVSVNTITINQKRKSISSGLIRDAFSLLSSDHK